MYIKPTTIKKLMQEAFNEKDIIISSSAYNYLAVRLEQHIEEILIEVGKILGQENENREIQRLPRLRKITDSHIKKVLERGGGNV